MRMKWRTFLVCVGFVLLICLVTVDSVAQTPEGVVIRQVTFTNIQICPIGYMGFGASDIVANGNVLLVGSECDPLGENPDASNELFLLKTDGTFLAQVTHTEFPEHVHDATINASNSSAC